MSVLLEYVKVQCLEFGTIAVYDWYLEKLDRDITNVILSKGSFKGSVDFTPEMSIYKDAMEIVKQLEEEGYNYHV
jgi:hypothetical protein